MTKPSKRAQRNMMAPDSTRMAPAISRKASSFFLPFNIVVKFLIVVRVVVFFWKIITG